ncbi:unnamed protein product [Orchesella dallaii]|uniref:Uncharacterized protein n=1 Tax=Orchesella dallaii TaxID=48710 RepID=A0ABP1RIA0_9HEXA
MSVDYVKRRSSYFTKLKSILSEIKKVPTPVFRVTQLDEFLERSKNIMAVLDDCHNQLVQICANEADITIQDQAFAPIEAAYFELRTLVMDMKLALPTTTTAGGGGGCFIMQYVGFFTNPSWAISVLDENLATRPKLTPAILDNIGKLAPLGYKYAKTRSEARECVVNIRCVLNYTSMSLSKYPRKFSKTPCTVQNFIVIKGEEILGHTFSLLLFEKPDFRNVLTDHVFEGRAWSHIHSDISGRYRHLYYGIPMFFLIENATHAHTLYNENTMYPYELFDILKGRVASSKTDLRRIWMENYANQTGYTFFVHTWVMLAEPEKGLRECGAPNYRHVLHPKICLHLIFRKVFNYKFEKSSEYDDDDMDSILLEWYSVVVHPGKLEWTKYFSYDQIFAGDFMMRYSYVLYRQRKGIGKGLDVFMLPFDFLSWTGFALLFLVSNIVLAIPDVAHDTRISSVRSSYSTEIFSSIRLLLQQPSIKIISSSYSWHKLVSSLTLLIWLLAIFIMLQFYTGSLFSFMTSEVPPVKDLDFFHLLNSSTLICVSGTKSNYRLESPLSIWKNDAIYKSELSERGQSPYFDVVDRFPYCEEKALYSLPERIASREEILTPEGTIPVPGEIVIISPPEEVILIEESMKFLSYFKYKSWYYSLPYVSYRTWMVEKRYSVLWRPIWRKLIESGIYGLWERNYEGEKRIKYLTEASTNWNSGKVIRHTMKSPYTTRNFFMWTHLADKNTVEGITFEQIDSSVLVSVFQLFGLCLYVSFIGLVCEIVIYYKRFMYEFIVLGPQSKYIITRIE